jgi:myo-inositol-1(or 4)-monophosphatase
VTSRQVTEPHRSSQATDADALLDVALGAARAAAASIRRRAAEVRSIVWRVKQAADFVSDVDTEAEEQIRGYVARHLPAAAILGEELSPDASFDRGIVFVADPLDGTTNFLHGFPWYAVSIGVLADGVLEAGVVINVPSGAEYTARRGKGAYADGQPMRVSEITDPGYALIGTGFPFKHLAALDAYQRQFAAVTRATAGIRRPGSAALDLVSVAAGQFDGFWELTLAPWDIAAGMLLVREAGGIVTDAAGAEARVGHSAIVAGNPAIHAWLMNIVKQSTT